jgi:hypothetical protein
MSNPQPGPLPEYRERGWGVRGLKKRVALERGFDKSSGIR